MGDKGRLKYNGNHDGHNNGEIYNPNKEERLKQGKVSLKLSIIGKGTDAEQTKGNVCNEPDE
ncbi:MAG: hypothetical protein M1833_006780 [Piccolia ochrophora]|nr:MAG: hypothetical protein M1833_006780 [Piccolia ochrophora]